MDELVKQLIKKIKKGDKEAYKQIIELFQTQVYNICLRYVRDRIEAEDLAQEAFIRAYVKIDTYQSDKKFSTWLYRIATNLSIDFLRKKRPSVHLDAELGDGEGFTLATQIESKEVLPEDSIIKDEEKDWVQGHIMALPEKYRSAIVLKYLEECSLKEISEILNIPVATVKTRIHRGREALRDQLRHE